MLIIQSESKPATMRSGVIDALNNLTLKELRICSAYMTLQGSQIFHECCNRFMSDAEFANLQKCVVTSFDFGLTDPAAIGFWQRFANTEFRVAGADAVRRGTLQPTFAFHPKLYMFFGTRGRVNALSGSANLTSRGFTTNTEAAWLERNITRQDADAAWGQAIEGTEPVTSTIIAAYSRLRRRTPSVKRHPEVQPVPRAAQPAMYGLPLFADEVLSGRLHPEAYSVMWIQVDRLQGGSRSQLELPRGAHRFFGFRFSRYEITYVVHIGSPILTSGPHIWDDRPLTWHGDNRMERINLPTLYQGGFDYEDALILFRRLPMNKFELIVAPSGSDLANAWLHASLAKETVYRIGSRTRRLAGLIQ